MHVNPFTKTTVSIIKDLYDTQAVRPAVHLPVLDQNLLCPSAMFDVPPITLYITETQITADNSHEVEASSKKNLT